MNSAKHEELIQDFFELLNATDYERMGEILADDVVYVLPHGSPYGEGAKGKEAMVETLEAQAATDRQFFPEGVPPVVLERVLEAGDTAVAEWSATITVGEKEHPLYGATVFRASDGKFDLIKDYFDTTELVSLLMSDEEKLLRRFLGAIDGYDYDTLASVLADDVIWRFPGEPPIGGVWHGRQAFIEAMRTQEPMEKAAFPGGSRTTVTGFLDFGDGRAAAEWTGVSKKADGAEVRADGLTCLEIRDGKIVSGQDYMELAPLLEHM